MNIINLTPHTLNIHTDNGVVDVPPSGTVARVSVQNVPSGDVDGIPLFKTTYGNVTDLPSPQKDTIFVVSGMVEAAAQRFDVFSPGDLVRDANGQPVGCKGLKQTS